MLINCIKKLTAGPSRSVYRETPSNSPEPVSEKPVGKEGAKKWAEVFLNNFINYLTDPTKGAVGAKVFREDRQVFRTKEQRESVPQPIRDQIGKIPKPQVRNMQVLGESPTEELQALHEMVELQRDMKASPNKYKDEYFVQIDSTKDRRAAYFVKAEFDTPSQQVGGNGELVEAHVHTVKCFISMNKAGEVISMDTYIERK